MNTDYPLLDARNVTKGESWSNSQSDHDAGINADPGDVIEFLVYYHNGAADAPENVANNVIVSASVPPTAGTQFAIGASISASNAATVSSSNHGGDMVVRISGPMTQTLSLVSGTTIWLPNRATSQQSMPNTITSGGVQLGSINGCWQYAGFVKFRLQVSNQQPNYTLSVAKEVRKLTDASFSEQVTVSPGDTVEFRIMTANTGTAVINSVFVRDTLPGQMTFVPGTLTISQTALSGDLFSTGVNVGAVNSGGSVTVKFQAQVAGESSFSVGNTTLQNTATVWGQAGSISVPQAQDNATVIVYKAAPQLCTVSARATLNSAAYSGAMSFNISGPTTLTGSSVPADFSGSPSGTYTPYYISGGPAGASFTSVTPSSGSCPSGGSITFTFNFTRTDVHNLTINKQVRNLTTGSSFADSTSAQPSQTVQFQITVQNTGNVSESSVNARDTLPNLLTYSDSTLTINGVANSSSALFFTTGLNIGSLAVNEIKTILFDATIASQTQFAVGTTVLTNTAYASDSFVTEKSDTATVEVVKQAAQKENGNPATRP